MNKKVVYLSIAVGLLLILSITMTYAYFSTFINGEGKDNVVETGTLSIHFEDGPELILNKAFPGDYVKKTFTVENTGTLDASYDIMWSKLFNAMKAKEV